MNEDRVRTIVDWEVREKMKKAEETYLKAIEEIKAYSKSTEFLLQIVEIINKMQIPETRMSEDERGMLK